MTVEVQNYLGIYVGGDRATVVCLGGESGGDVIGCFSVSVAGDEEAGYHSLANLISQGCSERGWRFDEVAVAVDCSMFMQHTLRSEFSDRRQIGSTIRFDAEEAMATDISDVALAYQMLSSDEHGSKVSVFTAKQAVLREIIVALQRSGMDPTSVEPDIGCLSRFLCAKAGDTSQARTLFGVLGAGSGYIVLSASDGQSDAIVRGRTFLIGARQNRQDVLGREVVVTTAVVETSDPISRVVFFDSAGQVDSAILGERSGIAVSDFDIVSAAGGAGAVSDGGEAVDFAIACGAGMSLSGKGETIDFRRDFMPYMGRRRRLEKTLKFTSVSVTILLVAVGLYFTSGFLRTSGYRGRLREKFSKDYAAVMYGKGLPEKQNPLTKLDSALKEARIKKAGGRTAREQASVAGKLTSVLEAMNGCASETKLNVDLMTITGKSMSVSGDTGARSNRNTLRFFEEIKKAGLRVLTQRLGSRADRDSFAITMDTQ